MCLPVICAIVQKIVVIFVKSRSHNLHWTVFCTMAGPLQHGAAKANSALVDSYYNESRT